MSLAIPAPEPVRPREAVSRVVPEPDLSGVLDVPDVPVAAVPVPDAAVPDIEPEAPIAVSAPAVPLVAAEPVPGVPTSPPLAPAVLSRLLPLLQAPTASAAASASTLLPIFTVRMASLSPLTVNVVRRGGRKMGAGGSALVPEQSHPGEHHRDPVLVGRRDDFLVAHGAAGLHDRTDAGLHGLIHPVAEGEEGVGAE